MTRSAKTEIPSPPTDGVSVETQNQCVDAATQDGLSPVDSPARELMMQIELEHAAHLHVDDGKWSARRTLAFIAISCGLFWMSLFFAATKIF